MTTTNNRRSHLPRVALGVKLRRSRRETLQDFERRNQDLKELKEYKRKNFPQENQVFTEGPLLSNIVKYPQTSCNQQRRQLLPKMILTNGSLRPFVTVSYTDTTDSIPVASECTATDTFTSPLASKLTSATTSPVRSSEQGDKELMNILQERSPEIDLSMYLIPQKTHLDFSQYLIQKPLHQQAETIVTGILQDLLDNLDFCEENGNQECQNKSSEKVIKATRFQRFRRSLKSLKTRFVRSMTSLTSCCRYASD